jgi:small subunit ribosomal protein S1
MNVGDKVKGKVVVLADYGAFIEIAPGVEGLIHVSEMSWSQHLRTAQDFLKIGDEVEAVILTLDREERKMSLGIKQSMPDPWEGIESRYPVESRHKSKVRNFTNFGVFVELEEGVDGLIHISDLSWQKKIKHPSEFCKVGEELEVVVLEINKDDRRISLGHKQLEENPWETFETIFSIGSIHEGTVMSVNDKGATIQMQYGVEAFAPSRHIKKADNTTMSDDETLEFEVIEFSKDAKRIIVSHTNIWKGAERASKEADNNSKDKARKNTTKVVKKMNQTSEKSTFGELDALTALRAQFEKAEKVDAKAKADKAEAKKVEAAAAETAAAVTEVAAPAAAGSVTLKSLSGVGPAMEKRMIALGVNNIEDLKGLSEEKIAAMTAEDAKISADQWGKWMEEAKSL